MMSLDLVSKNNTNANTIQSDNEAKVADSVQVFDATNSKKLSDREIVDSRNAVLRAKHEVIDKNFERAIVKLMNMTDNLYKDLIEAILKSHAENNEYVIIAERDVRRITQDWLNEVASKQGIRLVLSDEYHNDGGGIILSGKGYDKVLTFKATAKALKDKLGHKLYEQLSKL